MTTDPSHRRRPRRRLPLWPRAGKSNLRLVVRRPGRFVRAYRWPLLVLAVGAVLDTITTMQFMVRHGAADELHPAMRIMAEMLGVAFGVPLATVVRLGFVIFVAAVWRRWCGWVLLVCGLLYALAAASNYFDWLLKLEIHLASQ